MKIEQGFLMVFFPMIFCLSCMEEEPQGVKALEFSLVAIDGEGLERTVFEEGERIGIRVMMRNRSNEDLMVQTQLGCWFYQFEQFMKIYVCNGSGGVNLIGTSYATQHNCQGTPQNHLSGRETPLTRHYWDENPENDPLPVGKYCSFVQGEGYIDGVLVKVDMKVSFEVR
jgi:hypothetical protein